MKNDIGCIMVSILLGLGLATMFHKVCVGRSCVIVKGPNVDYVTKHMWRHGDDCFRYKVKDVDCPDSEHVEEQATQGADDDVI